MTDIEEIEKKLAEMFGDMIFDIWHYEAHTTKYQKVPTLVIQFNKGKVKMHDV